MGLRYGTINGKNTPKDLVAKIQKNRKNYKTNEDYIRHLPLEDIASYLISYRDDWGEYYGDFDGAADTLSEAFKKEIDWLKQPYEGE